MLMIYKCITFLQEVTKSLFWNICWFCHSTHDKETDGEKLFSTFFNAQIPNVSRAAVSYSSY